jgi:hypothetical protein
MFLSNRIFPKNLHRRSNLKHAIYLTQISVILILALIAGQTLISHSYQVLLLTIVVSITHLASICLLGWLSFTFIKWYRHTPNFRILSYLSSTCMMCIFIIISFLFVFNNLILYVGKNSSPTWVTNMVYGITYVNTYDNAYVISAVLVFITNWVASVFLLQPYSIKLGKAKFWLIVSLPLIYFAGQYLPTFTDVFSYMVLLDPLSIGLFYTVFFIGTFSVGGILAGLSFWLIAKKIPNVSIRNYVLFTAFGIMFVLTSIEPANLSISPYPPFGLTTLSFMILGSYLFLVGLYFSAKSISKDVNVRKSIRNTLHKKNFLEVIANSETESAVLKLVSPLINKVLEEESDSFYQPSNKEIKEMVQEAIIELQVEKRKEDVSS